MRVLGIFVIGMALMCTVDSQYTLVGYQLSSYYVKHFTNFLFNNKVESSYNTEKYKEICPEHCFCYTTLRVKCGIRRMSQMSKWKISPWIMLVW